MNFYIVTQICVQYVKVENGQVTQALVDITRKVEANSKEQAIGKFIVATQDIFMNQKLTPQCYPLDQLLTA